MIEIPKGLYSFDPSDPDVLFDSPGSAVREFADTARPDGINDDAWLREFPHRGGGLTLHIYQRRCPDPDTVATIAKSVALRFMDVVLDEFEAEWCQQQVGDWDVFTPEMQVMGHGLFEAVIASLLKAGRAYDPIRVGSVEVDAETIAALLSEPDPMEAGE